MSASSSSLPPTPVTLETLPFDNRALRELPVDPVEENYVREVRGACFSRVRPTPVSNPSLVVHSPSALALLGLTAPEAEARRPDFPALFAGNNPLPGAEPAAHCYCGHQFGSFAGQLGDGATMYLGEIRSPPASWPPSPLPSAWPVPPAAAGRVELQFKGAGKTPYSRSADGRKVLRSSIREFLCSEANAALGIPTTRAATVVTSDTRVVRDIFYVGNPIAERATVITRIAPTFLRFGSFEIFKGADGSTGRAGPSAGRADLLRLLVDFTGRNYYPELWTDAAVSPPSSSPANPPTGPVSPAEAARALSLFREVSLRTARLFAAWQCFGFCHGVLNTDNMSVVGVTIDYGPFGWMERCVKVGRRGSEGLSCPPRLNPPHPTPLTHFPRNPLPAASTRSSSATPPTTAVGTRTRTSLGSVSGT
jgi:serine/tyrosine/threonine adenylyltransferase